MSGQQRLAWPLKHGDDVVEFGLGRNFDLPGSFRRVAVPQRMRISQAAIGLRAVKNGLAVVRFHAGRVQRDGAGFFAYLVDFALAAEFDIINAHPPVPCAAVVVLKEKPHVFGTKSRQVHRAMHISVELRAAEVVGKHGCDARLAGFRINDPDRKGLVVGVGSVDHIEIQYQRRCHAAVHFGAIQPARESRRTIADAVVINVGKTGTVHRIGGRCGSVGQKTKAPGVRPGYRFGLPAFGQRAIVELFEYEIAGRAFAAHHDVVYTRPPGPGAAVVVADD